VIPDTSTSIERISMKSQFKRRLSLTALAGLALLGACADQDAVVQPAPAAGGELFTRYVAMGNSITAGIQSAGINDSTQLLAYPVLVAQQAGAPFNAPLLNKPGCPPPFVGPLGQGGVVGGAEAAACSFRRAPVPGVVQNVAVPQAVIADYNQIALSPDPNRTFNRAQLFYLGGQTMLAATARAQPTLVSVWLGNNDVLGAALSGNPAALTTEASFTASLDGLIAGLRAIPTLRDVILIGVVDVNVVPLLQPGAFFFLSRDATGRFDNKPVNDNCSPVTALGQPNALARNLISFEIVGNAAFPEINCSNEAYPLGDPRRGTFVLTEAEQGEVAARVAAFNALLQQRAQQNGWMFWNPNTVLAQLGSQQDAQGRYQQLRKCQALPAAIQGGSPAAIQQAVLTSCPVPNTGPSFASAAPNFFGALISFDGVHPSSAAHRHVANGLIQTINQKYQQQGINIPTLTVN
jgi:hypothetical protein